MAKLRPRQLEPGKIGPSKLGFDGEEDGWVSVKKQRVIIVLPPLPLPEHFTVEKPAEETSQSKAELKDDDVDTHETTLIHTMVPFLPVIEHCNLHNPATSLPQAELRDGIADTHETTPVHALVPSLPVPTTFQSQAELREDVHETTPVHGLVPSLPVPTTFQPLAELREDAHETTPVPTMLLSLPPPEHFTSEKPATSQSQVELDVIAAMHETTFVQNVVVPSLPVPEHCILQKPTTSQLQAELRVDTDEILLLETLVPPSLPVTEDLTLQKPATSQPQAGLREFVADTHETIPIDTLEPEVCPDFTSVDKPEKVMGRSLKTSKAPAPRRSLQDYRMDPDRRMEIRRNRTGHKPIRFPKVMCSSVVMDNEKLRVLNLERKVERAGGLNEWVGSIGLGKEFERMLRGQRMSKFQLANLTMEKLKHMGALAVGPRRKLIHAIRCVYHPHCLRASFN